MPYPSFLQDCLLHECGRIRIRHLLSLERAWFGDELERAVDEVVRLMWGSVSDVTTHAGYVRLANRAIDTLATAGRTGGP